MTPLLDENTRDLLDGANPASLTTLNPDGTPQTSIVFAAREDNTVVFSTTTGRLKTRNMRRDPRISVLVLDAGNHARYVVIRGTVQLVDDPEKALLRRLYQRHFGTPPPPEPDVDRLIGRLTPERIYGFPPTS